MVEKSSSSVISEIKKNSKGAFAKKRKEEPTIKGQQLPGDIIKGVAKFSSYKVGKDKGKDKTPFISMTGVIVEPVEFKGLKATKTIRFMNGKKFKGSDREPKTIEDRVAEMASDLQLLGHDISDKTEDDWEDLLKENIKDGTLFYFNTFKGPPTKDFPNPKTYVFIQGLVEEGYEPPDGSSTTVTDEEEPEAEEADETEEESEEETESDDYTDMSRNDLKKALKENSVDFKVTTKTTDDEIRDALRAATGEAEEEEAAPEEEAESTEEEWEPKKGDAYNAEVKGVKGKFLSTIVAVDTKKKTVDVKSSKDKKVYKGVSWDSLSGEE